MPADTSELTCEKCADDGGPWRKEVARIEVQKSGAWVTILFCCRYWDDKLERWGPFKGRFVRYVKSRKGYRVHRGRNGLAIFEMSWRVAYEKVISGVEWMNGIVEQHLEAERAAE